ncbi:hypothetical protein BCR44DRAFT_64998 [Catenaria anguillulae PL171]|uniref:Galactose oxidase n=1 Tax=Catenaria anguillulae PL171 TaxID=765915 RepID=A0A1Y2HS40_9FUNG|nr:hypothetical protein BCR44DRAFT_64998 [Catenaria anguillulae PL171]
MHDQPARRSRTRQVLGLTLAVLAQLVLLASTVHTQGITPGSSVIYFPEPHNRVLLAGGAVGLNSFSKVLVSMDLSAGFATSSPKIDALPQSLPEAFRFLTPAARTSDDGKSVDVTLFGGVNMNKGISQDLWSLTTTDGGKSLSTSVGVSTPQPKYSVKWGCHSGTVMAVSKDYKPQPNRGPIVVPGDNSVYVFGGLSIETYRNIRTLQSFNPADRTFRSVPVAAGSPTPRERNSASLVRIDESRLLLTGGWFNDTAVQQSEILLADAWTFDLKDNKWTKYPRDLTMPRFLHTTVVYKSAANATFAIVVGGQDGSPLVEYADVSKSGEWKRPNVAGKPDVKTLIEPQALLLGDQILVFGASLKENQRSDFMQFGVIKIKEEEAGVLSFAWADNFTPLPATANPVVEPEPSGGMDIGMIIAIVVCVIGVGGMGAFVYLRKRNQQQSALSKPAPLSQPTTQSGTNSPYPPTSPLPTPAPITYTPGSPVPGGPGSPYTASPATPHLAPYTNSNSGGTPVDHKFGVSTAPAPPMAAAAVDPYADLFTSPAAAGSAGPPPPMAMGGAPGAGHVELEIRDADEMLYLPTAGGQREELYLPTGNGPTGGAQPDVRR